MPLKDLEKRKEYSRQYREQHKEQNKKLKQDWYHRNKQHVLEKTKTWIANHKEQRRAIVKRYDQKRYSENPEKWRAATKNWYRANKSKVLTKLKAKRDANPQISRERALAWAKHNPQKALNLVLRRRARQQNSIMALTAKQQAEILRCGCFFSADGTCYGRLTIAHDIPVSKKGNTTRANVFCLCQSHNARMGTKTLAEMLKQQSLNL